MGAVPFQDAKCAASGNQVMSPTSTSSLAAPNRGLLASIDRYEANYGSSLSRTLGAAPRPRRPTVQSGIQLPSHPDDRMAASVTTADPAVDDGRNATSSPLGIALRHV
jgi:hypothetical protein